MGGDSLLRLIELAARAVDMSDASVSLHAGTTASPITTPGYDAVRGHLVARLDAAVVASGRPLAIPDLADHSGQGPGRRPRWLARTLVFRCSVGATR